MSLSLAQINIERDVHVERVQLFLEEHTPDVFCAQEIFERDVPFFEEVLGASSLFVPRHLNRTPDDELLVEGIAIFSRSGFVATDTYAIGGRNAAITEYRMDSYDIRNETQKHVLAVADIEHEGKVYRIATTHFPVTHQGSADAFQCAVLQEFLSVTATLGDFVVVGDFNAPRGGEIFSAIATHHTDNIPAEYLTSIDVSLHRLGKVIPEEFADKMVDGVFSTPGYTVSNVVMLGGVSDHCAVIADVEKT